MSSIMQSFGQSPEFGDAIENACSRIAPTWPLDQFIAVNPHWGWTAQSFIETAASLKRLAGSSFFMPGEYYLRKWKRQDIQPEHLQRAIDELMPDAARKDLTAWLDRDERESSKVRLLSDAVDAGRDLVHEPSWRDAITQQISQYCASFFDELQSDWRPVREGGLYQTWRAGMANDHGIAMLMRRPDIAQKAGTLPGSPNVLIETALQRLQAPPESTGDYLTALLLSVNGWAAWCAWLRWQARLQGKQDDQIVDLLAIRLAWEWLLDDGRRDRPSAWDRWRRGGLFVTDCTAAERHATVWQRAEEIAYQSHIGDLLSQPAPSGKVSAEPPFQAVFCIDVRSEVFRRALEHVAPEIQTIGFAGFFGLPIRYQPLGTEVVRPQLPGLLWPAMTCSDSIGDPNIDRQIARQRADRLQGFRSWNSFRRLPGSGFSLVESVGLFYLGKLILRSLVLSPEPPLPEAAGLTKNERAQLRPHLVERDVIDPARIDLAERVLRAMGLTKIYGRLVLLTGHGSQCANNPHRAGLDCGACGGQTGEVNARALAAMLNNPATRAGLVVRGLPIPESTVFVAGLHNTTTDEVELFDTDLAPTSSSADIAHLIEALRRAGERARNERAPALDLGELRGRPDALFKSVRKRALDWAQTRPEWGLAGNAAFVVAPRVRTRGINLEGRSFLHDYDWRADEDGSILELIMTAPMVVAHWINMQYYASTVDNKRFGSGDKVLHNVVGGRIGVFEGNSGDLRIGLPMQSLHNGHRWMHAPLRLSVFIQAPLERIDAVILKHDKVRQLLDGQWLHLFRLSDEEGPIQSYQSTRWSSPLNTIGAAMAGR